MCQIVIHSDVLCLIELRYFVLGHDFCSLCGMFWALKILCFSLWNSPVTPGRNLLSEELECGHEESRRNVLLE